MQEKSEYKLDRAAIRLVEEPPLYSPIPMDSPLAAVSVMAETLKGMDREVIGVINLDSQLRPVNVNLVSIGTLNQSIVHPREILKSAILSNASSVMLFHNHPSGLPKPSGMDWELTQWMEQVCQLIGIPLEDHIIIGRMKYYSFKEQKAYPLPDIYHSAQVSAQEQKQTVVVNAFAGPGAGKTTSAWEIAAELKKKGMVVEYVSEYAKELVWEGNFTLLDQTYENQMHIYEEQKRRIDRLIGKVDVIVTDSPTVMSVQYLSEEKNFPEQIEAFRKMAVDDFKQYRTFNYFIRRGEEYEQEGRIETHEEAKEIDRKIREFLTENHIYFGTYYQHSLGVIADNIEKHCTRNREKTSEHKETKPESMPSSLERAKELINDYCFDEFGYPGNFKDLTRIHIGYTTITDEEIPVQASVNLVEFRLERFLDGELFDSRQYDSLEELIEMELEYLDFDTLMNVTENEIAEVLGQDFVEEKVEENELASDASDGDSFSIYQLKHGLEQEGLYFMPYEYLQKKGHSVDPANYEIAYTAPLLPDTSPEDIYTRFNINPPEDFTGHSLSMSDVVVLHRNGEDTAYYVDSFGYQEIPGFLPEKEQEPPFIREKEVQRGMRL